MIQEILHTPLVGKWDVVVCGGGFAGIAASLAAARAGQRTLLLEREYILGGLGTAGLVTVYLPLCDGVGRQVSFGIAEELFRLSISMGAEADYPANWLDSRDPARRTKKDRRFEVRYNPNLFAMLAEKRLLEEGVEILYGTHAVQVVREKDRIEAVIFENKSGRQAVSVGSVVDATGDCDIAWLAGAPTENFRQGNVLAAWYYFLGEAGYDLKALGASDIPEAHKGPDFSRTYLHPERFVGVEGQELSRMVQLSHGAILEDIRKKREKDPTAVPTAIASIPQVRMTRKLRGEYTLDEGEKHTFFPDSIGMVSDWKTRGPVYEVPFRTLYSREVENLLVAGRCTSVTETMWDIMRVIPCCAVTGQAAGLAAAMGGDLRRLDVSLLQKKLEESGVKLHEKDL